MVSIFRGLFFLNLVATLTTHRTSDDGSWGDIGDLSFRRESLRKGGLSTKERKKKKA